MTLAEFLSMLATDHQKRSTFNSSVAQATQQMAEAGLSAAAQDAVLSHDIQRIHNILYEEGHGQDDFTVPGGPENGGIMIPKFRVTPEGD
jgi:hypothetical protein